jgi:tetratricopeptide (TPR) repeat protein
MKTFIAASKSHLVPLILLILVSGILFANTFRNSFMWDDKELIIQNSHIQNLKEIPYLFTPRYWAQYNLEARGKYRPLRTVTFALDYSLWGLEAEGYHLTNLILHILNVILCYCFIWRLVGPHKSAAEEGEGIFSWNKLLEPAFLSALFFAVHPIHTESVTWIKNRSEMLSLLFFLASLLLFIKYRLREAFSQRAILYTASILFFILALFSKEMALSLPLVLLLYILSFLPRQEYWAAATKTLPFLAIAAAYLIGKLIYLGLDLSAQQVAGLNPYTHILVILSTFGTYLKLLLLPIRLNAERLLTIPHSFREAAVLGSGALLALIGYTIAKTHYRARRISFALLWILATLLPVSNIFFLTGRPLAEQRLYIPSVGFSFLLALGIGRLASLGSGLRAGRRSKQAALLLSLFILIFYSATTIRRNLDWKDSVTFWSKTVESSPRNARAYHNLGLAYYEANRKPEAISAYEKAIELSLNYVDAYCNLGIAYYATGRREEAIELLRKAIKIKPGGARLYYNLGLAYYDMGRKEEAINLFEKAIGSDPDYALAHNNLAVAYYHKEKYNLAIRHCDRAIELKLNIHPDFLKALLPYRNSPELQRYDK